MKQIIALWNKLLDNLFGEKCPNCGKRELQYGYWSRGYNELCRQACGDSGDRCYECGYIRWRLDYESYKSSLPHWCRAYDDPHSRGELSQKHAHLN